MQTTAEYCRPEVEQMYRSCTSCSRSRPLRLLMMYAALVHHVAVTWPCSDHWPHTHTASCPPTCKASPRSAGQLCQRCTLPLTAAMRAGSAMSCQHGRPLQHAAPQCKVSRQPHRWCLPETCTAPPYSSHMLLAVRCWTLRQGLKAEYLKAEQSPAPPKSLSE